MAASGRPGQRLRSLAGVVGGSQDDRARLRGLGGPTGPLGSDAGRHRFGQVATFIAADNKLGGTLIGKAEAEYCASKNPCKVGIVEGDLADQSGRDENSGMRGEVAKHANIHATHVRNRDTEAVPSIAEALRTAVTAGVSLQISHLIPRRAGQEDAWRQALSLVDGACADGLDVAFDAHTRLHGMTNLSMILPPEVLAAPVEELTVRLRDPQVRARIRQYPSIVSGWGVGGWDRVFLFSSARHPELVGKSMAELAPAGGDAILDILLAESDAIHSPMGICACHDESWLRATMVHPLCMVGSDATALCLDGPLSGSTFLGAYTWAAWFFRRLVREWSDLCIDVAETSAHGTL